MAHQRNIPGLASTLLVLASALVANRAAAAEYDLRAGVTTLTMPDGTAVPAWGFACEAAVPPAVCPSQGVVTVPGPALAVSADDPTLTINLTNELSVPVSIVISGQAAPMTPVWTDGTSGPRTSPDQRVRSFTHEAGPSGGTATYAWTGLKAGTWLYQSGTHPQVQVQMGLYGPVVKPAAAGLAYDGVAYDLEHVLLLSEVDPALHVAVATGAYGTPSYPSALDYRPRYFLVNGAPFTSSTACLDGQSVGSRILLRMLNAGLRELAPTLLGGHWDVVAEGGSPFRISSGGTSSPRAKEQYSLLLPPGGTADVVLVPEVDGVYRILDRRLNLTNAAAPGGGFQACVAVGAQAGRPIADAGGPYTGTGGTPIAFDGTGSVDPDGGALTYAWSFGDGGTSTAATPSHVYAAAGTFTVRLVVTDDEGLVSAADVTTAAVAPANGVPVADANGPYAGKVGFAIAFDGSGSSDPEGAPLTYAWSFGDGSTATGVAPSHTYANAGDYAVTLTVSDGHATSAPATASAHVTVNTAPIANPGGPYQPTGLRVTFDGSGSSDPNGDPLTWAWNFGDGTTGTGVAPIHDYPLAGTYTVTLRVNDGFVNSAPATTTATITASPPQNKHVGDLDWTRVALSSSRWRATVTVTVHGTSHLPLANVKVNAAWSSGDGNGRTTSCTTGANGTCTLTSGRLSRIVDPSVQLTVNSLTGAGATYVQTVNHDPDGPPQNSNGTSVTVPRP
jgi:PKD repeat protein